MNRTQRSSGFTLVELLVVVGIVAMLIALLLPVLHKARAAAQAVVCLSNLRGIGQAMAIYAAENGGAIAGSGSTSGRHLWRNAGGTCVLADPSWSIHNIPGPIECSDYIHPLAKAMGLRAPTLDSTNGVAKFAYYLTLAQFRCPSTSDIPSAPDPAGVTSIGSAPALSYVTANAFLTIDWTFIGTVADEGFQGNVISLPHTSQGPYILPGNYFPKVTKVGNPAEKIYLADGTRRMRLSDENTVVGPRYRLSSTPSQTRTHYTSFSDIGAFYGDSAAYLRHAVPGNSNKTVSVDPRPISYRHGARGSFAATGAYRLNAVFFDGHAETLDELRAAHPALWLPQGTRLIVGRGVSGNTNLGGTKVVWRDVQERAFPGTWGPSAPTYLVP